MSGRAYTLDHFACADPRDFVDVAYGTIIGRAPTPIERERMVAMLVAGDARTFALGTLRYGREGRERGVTVAGLRGRYLAQRLFRMPVLGAAIGWLSAFIRLPRTLRYFRGAVETRAVHHSLLQRQQAADHAALERTAADAERMLADIARHLADVERRLADAERGVADAGIKAAGLDRTLADAARSNAERFALLDRGGLDLGQRVDALTGSLRSTVTDLQALADSSRATRAHLDAMHPPPLDPTMAIPGEPLVALARERGGVAADVALGTLSAHSRYALFETVFYDSRAVAEKQRIYIDFVDRDLAREAPFIDLGCGRGEFLRILRELSIDAIGVDINTEVLRRLGAEGFNVVEQDLLAFLEGEHRMFSGAAVLQVAEHLDASQIERMLALLARRLLPGAPLIIETPNPLSPFALGVFHTDPTHVNPIPPERMRYSIEAAGFEQTLTLFQAKIPADQFAGPDPRAYYADYAIIARRSAR